MDVLCSFNASLQLRALSLLESRTWFVMHTGQRQLFSTFYLFSSSGRYTLGQDLRIYISNTTGACPKMAVRDSSCPSYISTTPHQTPKRHTVVILCSDSQPSSVRSPPSRRIHFRRPIITPNRPTVQISPRSPSFLTEEIKVGVLAHQTHRHRHRRRRYLCRRRRSWRSRRSTFSRNGLPALSCPTSSR